MIKRFVVLPAFLLALSAPALAQEAIPVTQDAWPSTTTRAQVIEEFLQACLAGKISHGEAGHVFDSSTSVLSRAQVAAEAAEALRLGLIPVGNNNARVATADELRQIRRAGERVTQFASAR